MTTPPPYSAPIPPAGHAVPGQPTIGQPIIERVGRGLAFAAIVIPGGFIAAAVVFSLLPGIPIVVTAAGGLLVSSAAQWLYQRGAGTPAIKGLLPLIGIVVVAVIVTGLAGVVGNVYAGFQSVGGRGGPFGETFRATLASAIERDPTVFLLITALLAVGGLLGFVNKNAREARRVARASAAGGTVPPFQGAAPYGAPAPISFDGPPPPAPAAPVAHAPVAPPVAAQPPVVPVAPPTTAAAPPAPPAAPTVLPGVTMTPLPGSAIQPPDASGTSS